MLKWWGENSSLGGGWMSRIYEGLGGGFISNNPQQPPTTLEQLPSPDESGLRFASRGKDFYLFPTTFPTCGQIPQPPCLS